MRGVLLLYTIAIVNSALIVQSIVPEGTACNNTADLGVFKTHASDFHSILQKCATSSMGNAEKVASCLATNTGLSAGCSGCFGTDAHCVAVNCLSKCITNPNSADCLQCQVDKCQPALVDCTGVPASDLPHADVIEAPLDGACNNTADLNIYKTQASTFKAAVQKCATSTMGDASKTASCLATATGISAPCSMCWGTDAHCVATKCLSKCLVNPSSAACLQCNEDNCLPGLVTCGGVPAADLPHADVVSAPEGTACNNTADLGVFKTHATDFHSILQKCATSSMGNAEKVASCLATNTGLSAGCSGCFGTDAHCVAVNCLSKCITNPNSADCLQCQVDKCQPALLDCAGVPSSDIPH